MELSDANRTRLARYKAGLPVVGGGKRLEVLLPCDDFVLDLIVVSGMTAARINKLTDEAVSEVVQALVGM